MTDAPQLSSDRLATISNGVATDYKNGSSSLDIVLKLMKTPELSSSVRSMVNTNVDPDQIVAHFGGEPLAHFKATDPTEKVKQQNFFQNAWGGIKKAGGDIALGAKQVLNEIGAPVAESNMAEGGAYNPEMHKQMDADQAVQRQKLFDEAKAREADPTNQALSHTAGGTIGNIGTKALPYIAASVLAPEGTLPAMAAQGLAGASSGLVEPTTDVGQRGKNVVVDSLLGAGTEGVGRALVGGTKALASKLSTAGKDTTLAADMTAQGLTPTTGTTNSLVKAVSSKLPESHDALIAHSKTDMARAALKQVGVDGADLSPANLDAAEKAIWKPANDAVKGIGPVAATPELKQSLAQIVTQYSHDALPTFANSKVASIVEDVVKKADDGQLTGSRLLDYLRDTKDLAFNADNAADRTAFKSISTTLNDALKTASPDGGAALARANELHPKLLVLRDVAARAKDELPTVQQWSTSNSLKRIVKTDGTGPYSDLVGVAKRAYMAPAGTTGRWGSLLANAVQYGPATIGGISGLVDGGVTEGIAHGLAGHAAEKGLAKILAKVAVKPVTGVRQANAQNNQKLKAAIAKSLRGSGTAGKGAIQAAIANKDN